MGRHEVTERMRKYADEANIDAEGGGLLFRPIWYIFAWIIDFIPDFINDTNANTEKLIENLSQALEVANAFNSEALIKDFTALPRTLYQEKISFKNGQEGRTNTWLLTQDDNSVIWSHSKIKNSQILWISIGQPNSREIPGEPSYLNAEDFFQPETDITQFQIETKRNNICNALGLPDQVKLRLIHQTKKASGYVDDIGSNESSVQADPSVWLKNLRDALPTQILSNLKSLANQ